MLLTDHGVALEDVYGAGGEVLMGTLRWEKENALIQEQQQIQFDVERKKRELELLEAETKARIESLNRELEAHRSDLEALEFERSKREKDWKNRQEENWRQRSGDAR